MWPDEFAPTPRTGRTSTMTVPTRRVRAVLADAHRLARTGLATVLAEASSIEVVGEAASTAELVPVVGEAVADLVVIDDALPGPGIVPTVRQLARLGSHPRPRCLVLSGTCEQESVLTVLHAGAGGCLSKDSEPRELASAALLVAAGHLVIASTLASPDAFLDHRSEPPVAEESLALASLTRRETEVLRLLAGGLPNRRIAEALTIQESTVKSHVHAVLSKLELRDRAQAVAFAHQCGLMRGCPHPSLPDQRDSRHPTPPTNGGHT